MFHKSDKLILNAENLSQYEATKICLFQAYKGKKKSIFLIPTSKHTSATNRTA